MALRFKEVRSRLHFSQIERHGKQAFIFFLVVTTSERYCYNNNENKIGHGKSAIVVQSQPKWDNLWNQGEKIKTENIVEIFDNFNNAINWINE